jgi:hypothetical protein
MSVCPKCHKGKLNNLETRKWEKNTRKYLSLGAKICIACNIIIPEDPTLSFWNGAELVKAEVPA